MLADIDTRHKTARLALKSWGDGARYAGAKDRAFVSGMVLDVLRRRRSLAFLMGEDSHRARVLGVLFHVWNWPHVRIAEALDESYGPGSLTESEAEGLSQIRPLDAAPMAVRGDYPDWLDPHMTRVFGSERVREGTALAERAPVDLRVNTLKTDIARALKALEPFGPVVLDRLGSAVRIPPPTASERAAPVESSPEFERGWFEVQDLGSQIAASSAGEIKGRQVLDFCAGGGGKTLALAAAMGNSGQLYAYDADARRLTDTVRRSLRAGVRNLQVRSPIHADVLADLEGRMDVVFVDAPCTGSGTWRRHPDAKWRLTPEQLGRRMSEQDRVLDDGARYVRAGGRLIYVTCSLFAEENEDRLTAFLSRNPQFAMTETATRLTPRSDGTDGFFIGVLSRAV